MADIYNPSTSPTQFTTTFVSEHFNVEYIFLAGAGPLGAFALGAGFVRNKVAITILRALSGCGTLSLRLG